MRFSIFVLCIVLLLVIFYLMDDLTPKIVIPNAELEIVIPQTVQDIPAQIIGGWQGDTQQLSSGKMIFQSKKERILIGDATAPMTGIGVFIGKTDSGKYVFRVGDPNGNYIYWDGSNLTQNSLLSVIDSYNETNYSNYANLGATQAYDAGGQAFTATASYISLVKFYLTGSASVSGTMTAKLYASTGTYGTSAVPTGSALATSSVASVASLSTSPALINFSFDGTYRMVEGTKYIIVLDCSGVSAGSVGFGLDTSSPTHSGNESLHTGVWTADANVDAIFYVYGFN